MKNWYENDKTSFERHSIENFFSQFALHQIINNKSTHIPDAYSSCTNLVHCMKSVQIRSFFWSVLSIFGLNMEIYSAFSPNTGKYGPEKTPYLDLFHVVVFTFQPNLVVESGVHPFGVYSSFHPNCHHQIVFAKFKLKM